MELAKAGKKQLFTGCFWQKAAHACFLQKQLFLLLPTLTAAADAPLGGAKNRYNDTDHAKDTPLDGAKNRYSGTDYATDPPRGAQTQRSMGQAQKESVIIVN